jgi:L-lactate dehydrogenase complex protein LldG
MDQSSFLARVREAAHAGRAHRISTKPIPEGTGYVGGGADLCQHMADEVEAVGGHAVIVADATAALRELAALLEQYRIRSALLWEHELLQRWGLRSQLEAQGITAHAYADLASLPQAEQRRRVLAMDAGITSCSYAIAETGTLAMMSRPGQERMASLVPPVHIALIDDAQILPDLFDLFRMLQLPGAPPQLPTNLTLITGPSKTGDIELQLTTGVHGPKHWHVIIVRS